MGLMEFDRLNVTLSTKSQDITEKLPKIGLQNKTSKIWQILADVLEFGAYFSKPIFALKPWDWACRFSYHEPYNENDFFSLIRGSEKFWGSHPQAKKTQN